MLQRSARILSSRRSLTTHSPELRLTSVHDYLNIHPDDAGQRGLPRKAPKIFRMCRWQNGLTTCRGILGVATRREGRKSHPDGAGQGRRSSVVRPFRPASQGNLIAPRVTTTYLRASSEANEMSTTCAHSPRFSGLLAAVEIKDMWTARKAGSLSCSLHIFLAPSAWRKTTRPHDAFGCGLRAHRPSHRH